MTMTELKPALTAEHWASVRRLDHVTATSAGISFVGPRFGGGRAGAPSVLIDASAEFAEGVALFNHALPDESPYKLVAADLWAVIQATPGDGYTIDMLSHCLDCGVELQRGSDDFCREHLEARLSGLAAKLAALLPPEG